MKKFKMRIYLRNTSGYVDYKDYTTEVIDPESPFPLESFLTIYDYAIEDKNGDLKWLKRVRSYNGNEYPEFSGQEHFEERGKIIWQR